MIVFLEGILDQKEPMRVVVQVGGVGHEALIPLSSFDRLPAEGQRVRVLIYDHVREDDHLLYGFMTAEERRVFILLLSVNGVGPKLALSVLSGLSTRDFKMAVTAGDAKRLSSVQGIGRKTAERIILDLKDKFTFSDELEAATTPAATDPDSIKMRDAVLALIALGYKRSEAEALIRRVLSGSESGTMNVESVIRKALAG